MRRLLIALRKYLGNSWPNNPSREAFVFGYCVGSKQNYVKMVKMLIAYLRKYH